MKIIKYILIVGIVIAISFYVVKAANTFPTTLNSFSSGDTISSDWGNSLESKIGIDSSAVATSLDYLLKSTFSSNPGHKHTLANSATDVTATYTELNYVDGVTSAIQTQLDTKLTASPFGASIDDTELTAEDFGDWTCTGSENGCTIDSGVITVGDLASADFSDFTCNGTACTIDANAVALATDTTGNYVATIAGSLVSVSGSGSENAAVTLGIMADSLDFTELQDQLDLDASTQITFGTYDYTFNLTGAGSNFLIQYASTTIADFGNNGNISLGDGLGTIDIDTSVWDIAAATGNISGIGNLTMGGSLGIGTTTPSALFTINSSGDKFTVDTSGNVVVAGTLGVTGTITGDVTGALTGNASTASALASNPTDCGANTWATTIADSGNLTCSAVTYAGITAMSSANINSIVNDNTGSGLLTFATSPRFTTSAELGASGQLRFYDSDSSNYVGFQATSTVASDISWILPAADGTSSQVLTTDGSSNLSWSTAAGAGDVLSVGDCADGACLDGSADGGEYIRIYDGNSNYAELNVGDIGSNYIVYLPLSTGTLALSGANSDITSLSGLTTALTLSQGGTGKNLTADAGGIPYFDADSLEVLADGAAGTFLKSGGTGAPSWAGVTPDDVTATAGAKVYMSTTYQLNLTDATYLRVDLDSEDYDIGGDFDTGTLGTGTADGDTASHLIDGGYDFAAAGIKVGHQVWNTTDSPDTPAYITAVASGDLTLTADIFPDGTDNWKVLASRFTAPITGYYYLEAGIWWTATVALKEYSTVFYKNGSGIMDAVYHTALAESLNIPQSRVVYLSANDYVELWTHNASGVSTCDIYTANTSRYTWFTVHLISK